MTISDPKQVWRMANVLASKAEFEPVDGTSGPWLYASSESPEHKGRLEAWLQAHGGAGTSRVYAAVEPLLVWGAFRDFAHVPFNAPLSVLRFLAGVRAASTGDKFEIEIGRQFGVRAFTRQPFCRAAHFYLVGVKLIYPPDESLLPFIEQRFSQRFQPTREFLQQIEALPIFKIAFHMMRPTSYEITTF